MKPDATGHQRMSSLTEQFLNRSIDPARFGHEQHVRVAYDLLDQRDFLDATVAYVDGIRDLARKAGAPGKFHMTITLAYLSVIAERMAAGDYRNVDEFVSHNDDLLSTQALSAWYGAARLDSPLAREQFVLPDTPPTSG